MKIRVTSRTVRCIIGCGGYALVYLSAFFLSGTRQSPLELDPSWQAALEYAATHHFQFGTQIVFTFGPLGFLSTRTSLGQLVDARIVFAFFWSLVIALAALGTAKRLPGWVRYAFLAWLVVFTLSGGIDQVALFVLAYGAILLLTDNAEQRWQMPLFILAFILLSLIKFSFLIAAWASVGLVVFCWIWQRKILKAVVLGVAMPSAFVAAWLALAQSPSHLIPFFRRGWELTRGYSAAMNLSPKTPVLLTAAAALMLFAGAFIATSVRAPAGIVPKAILITIAQYVFLAWKEGFTRSGDWHAYVFLWFLPLGIAWCFLEDIGSPLSSLRKGALGITFAAAMALCVVAANLQIPQFAARQVLEFPGRVARNAVSILTIFEGHKERLYADCYNSQKSEMLALNRAKDVIGGESVDVMNYLALAAVINGMNYRPRPVFQGFVAYTPALQALNERYFQGAARPHFVLLCHEATDGRFPMLEDSAALNYVLNNYVPVAQDGRFLVLQQRTTAIPKFQLLQERSLRFGEKLDLRAWSQGPLFMAVEFTPRLVGRAAALVYQPHPLFMRVEQDRVDLRYRIIPSMASQPFLLSPLLESNFDIINLYAERRGKQPQSVTFERSWPASWEFQDSVTVRLYGAPGFLQAAHQVPIARMLADVQGRVFWPDPESIESAGPARVVIYHGSPALAVRGSSTIALEIPPKASLFSGYFGIPDENSGGSGEAQNVEIKIVVHDRTGQSHVALDRLLQPLSRADDLQRIHFDVPIAARHERSVTLTATPVASGNGDSGWVAWSQCRFDAARDH